jgi:hypothetical protein
MDFASLRHSSRATFACPKQAPAGSRATAVNRNGACSQSSDNQFNGREVPDGV